MFLTKYFKKFYWLEITINLYCILAIFLPISGLFSSFINKSYLVFWKEFLVSIIFVILIPSVWQRRNFIPKSLQILFLSFVILTFLVIINSIWIQNLPIKAIFLGFRFELWWLFLFILNYSLNIILKREQIEKRFLSKIPNSTEFTELTHKKFVNVQVSNQNLDSKHILENSINYFTKFVTKLGQNNKINSKQKIHFSVYLGFLLLIIVYFASLVIGQTEILRFFGFENNSSQITGQICHLVDFGQNSCRLTLGFGSPNHLAGYLLLVLPVFWSDFFEIFE